MYKLVIVPYSLLQSFCISFRVYMGLDNTDGTNGISNCSLSVLILVEVSLFRAVSIPFFVVVAIFKKIVLVLTHTGNMPDKMSYFRKIVLWNYQIVNVKSWAVISTLVRANLSKIGSIYHRWTSLNRRWQVWCSLSPAIFILPLYLSSYLRHIFNNSNN